MAEKRTALVCATVKRFYKPAELTELLGLDAAEIRRYTFLAGALYQVARIDLVDGPRLYQFVNQFGEMIEDQEGVFFEVDAAAEKLGVRADTIPQMLADPQLRLPSRGQLHHLP